MKKIVLFFLATLIWLICAAVGFFLYILINKIFGETALLIAPGLFLLLCFFSVMWENKHVGHSRIRISYCGTMILLAFLLFLQNTQILLELNITVAQHMFLKPLFHIQEQYL